MTRFYETMRAVVERHGGAVEKFIGDAVVATFGAPEVHEDDAVRAVRAAQEMHAALDGLNDELQRRWAIGLQMRTGVATGDVLAGGGAAVLGSPANLAARLQASAREGEIVLAADTERLVRATVRTEALSPIEAKGFEEPVERFRLVGVEGRSRPRSHLRYVGREQEIVLLDLAYRRAVRDRRPQLVTVVGEPGIGKTRLVDEAIARLDGGPVVLRGRCLPYGEGITFFPVAEAVAEAAGITREDDAARAQAKVAATLPDEAATIAARVSEAIGLGGSAAEPEETLWAIRRYFELQASERPLVLVFDDLHWAEPTFLDLVIHLVERSRDVAELVVAIARPELYEQRPGWAGGVVNAAAISIEPLTDAEGAELVRHLLPGGAIAADVAARLAAPAGGNPLFLEEYVTMLVDEGAVIRHGDRWEISAGHDATASTPPTLLGMLAARIHRLPPDERDLLVRSSVIGSTFTLDEAEVLSDDAADLDAIVARLVDRGVLAPTGDADGSFRFAHQLLRDTAYASLPRTRRAALHERFADHLESAASERPEELDEIAGFHLAEAHDDRIAIGVRDETTTALALRAAARSGTAGRRAVERGDASAGIRLLSRAVALAPTPEIRVPLRLPLCQAMSDAADPTRFHAELSAAIDDAVETGDDRIRLRFELLRLASSLLYDPLATPPDELVGSLEDIAEALAAFGDDEGLAECHYHLASVAWFIGDVAAFERSARRALERAIAAGNTRSVARAAEYVVNASIRGRTPLPAVLEELERLFAEVRLGARAAAELRAGEAEILAYLDRPEEARASVRSARADLDDLGVPRVLAAIDTTWAIVEDEAGDLAASEAAARRAYEFFRDNGDVGNGSLVAGQLADVLARMGRSDEAMRQAEEAAEMSPAFDIESQAGWRMASARATAALGDPGQGISIAEDGLRILEGTDLVLLGADLERTFGDVLEMAGRTDEATARRHAALDAYRAKGHVVGARRVTRALSGAGHSA
jgi:tetratricopeptide (TPR) repeat protein